MSRFRHGVGAILVGLLLVADCGRWPSVSEARHVQGRACAHHTGEGIRARERYLGCEARRIGVSPATALATARCESGADLLDYGAPYAGPFQQIVGDTFRDRFRTWILRHRHPLDGIRSLRAKAAHFRTNVLVSLRMARAYGFGYPHWPNCP